ncbi:DUF4838 domain-containing protein [Brevifollis gellanilyticus]|uniref:Alpha glucuronidase N-terminal domain-containing protein n=1 Tax=Brevifollis gellanilyticus TaxID=748831 RepID=A0A512MA65_9BACT|nr:DUF4838 domain-containing protein [Brevifollis gellanilyticus]GEP43630.1 hypothetical protein BGE01nite_29210 [Brevifollis gellanilyticus]
MLKNAFVWFLLVFVSPIHAVETFLAKDGRAFMEVTYAGEALKTAATELAGMLTRITGAEFVCKASESESGIHLALQKEAVTLTGREGYHLESFGDRIEITGATPQAVEHAVWDLLHRVGFRQFLPGKTWEVVPSKPSLSVDVKVTTSPDYHSRRIWAGFGYLKEREAVVEEWNRRNRATSGITLNTGHAYDHIMDRHAKVFEQHPEYLAMVDGKRQKPKFCTSNAELRKLVVEDALAQFAAQPDLDSVSCDPSDGGGWCECAECAKIGSVTDRALLLANDVAASVDKAHPGRMVGMYAYNEHSPPPSIEAHPQVVISVATGFIRGGYTIDQLLDGWSAKARTLGIREYYSVNAWDRDLPGAARGGNIDYLRTTIPHFHARGARFMSAEASDNAGPNGLGCYLAARMFWDVDEAKKIDALVTDFLESSFGAASGPMRKFYEMLDGSKKPSLSDDLLGRMWRRLQEARGLTKDKAILARLDDLALYTHYCGLYLDYSSASGKERQAAFEAMFRFLWRIRDTGMVHVKALWRDVPNRDKGVTLPPGAKYNDPEAANPWKTGVALKPEEIAKLVDEGVEKRKLLDFEPVAFSMKLVPATKLKLTEVPRGNAGIYLRGVRDFWTWVDAAPATISLTGTAGVIYPNRGPAKMELYPLAEAELKSVAHLEIDPDKKPHELKMGTKFPGLHRIEVTDSTQGTSITWQDGMPMTIVSSMEQPAKLFGRWHLYFYVPKGTKMVGGYSDGEGLMLDPEGKTVHTFSAKPGYFSMKVPKGMDGQLWSFKHTSGQRQLMTVPPCLARDASELLLPEEVVVKETQQ